jgi:hypothetical protein
MTGENEKECVVTILFVEFWTVIIGGKLSGFGS